MVAWIGLAACRITDHSEGNTVTTGDLGIPASGYRAGDPTQSAGLRFDSSHWDMGQVAEGQIVEKTWSFVNDGKRDLIITDVRGSCGCTVGKDWPRKPVPPGERGSITVSFDSQGRPGKQHKTVTVVANTDPPTTVLTLQGEVVAAPVVHADQ
jgi:hypothetical protein